MVNIDEYYLNLKDQTNDNLGLYLFCCSICVIWTVYVLFFNSRVVGALLTFVINFYLRRRRRQLLNTNGGGSASGATNGTSDGELGGGGGGSDLSQPVWIKIRSVSISFLSGKIMFRGVHYVTLDYMLYIQDGWLTFAYWKPSFYTVNTSSSGSSKKSSSSSGSKKSSSSSKKNQQAELLINGGTTQKRTARLNIFLCNFQLHYYNSWKLPTATTTTTTPGGVKNATGSPSHPTGGAATAAGSSLEQMDTKSNGILGGANSILNYFTGGSNKRASGPPIEQQTSVSSSNNLANNSSDYNFTEDLMQLFSVVNIRIQKGRVFAGNSTLPSTLTLRFSNAKLEFVTEKSQSKVDDYCFILRGDLNKLEASLIPNKKHHLMQADPFHAGEKGSSKLLDASRVLIMRCVACDFEYVQDVPSILTFDRRYLQKTETGELIENEKEPQWSMALNCNKHTVINYGPWYDRQREILWKYFFPPTYEELEPHPEPTLNERRQTSKFDFVIKFNDPNTELNVLFGSSTCYDPASFFQNLNGNPNAANARDSNENIKNLLLNEKKMSLKVNAPSKFECSIPWLTKQYGYKTVIVGEFNSVKSSTSLTFDKFMLADQLRLNIDINYPLIWNDMQTWNIGIELTKASTYFVFYHKNFFQDLINDWSSRHMSDLRHFVPYVYRLNVNAVDLEVILPCNQHNWIDTVNHENNNFFAVLTRQGKVSFDIPFRDFCPPKTDICLDVKISDGCARFILPPTNKNLTQLKILRNNIKYISLTKLNETRFDSDHWSQFNMNYNHNQSETTITTSSTSKRATVPSDMTDGMTKTPVILETGGSSAPSTSRNPTTTKPSTKATSRSGATTATASSATATLQQGATTTTTTNNNPSEPTPTPTKAQKTTNVRFAFGTTAAGSSGLTSKSNESHMQENWIECWQTKTVEISLGFEFYLCPVLDWSNEKLPSVVHYKSLNSPNFDCETLPPDTIRLKIEIGPSIIMLYGTMLKRLWYIKEGYFSWDQYYTEMLKNLEQILQQQQQQQNAATDDQNKTKPGGGGAAVKSKISRPYLDVPVQLVACNYRDPRNFRSLSVYLSLAIHNLNGHVVLDISEGVGNVPLPIAFSDRLALELDKSYRETRLQLYVDPVNVFIEDLLPRTYDRNLFQGHLCLSNVQLRGHAMFSDENRLKTDTLEYAWLLEILLGDVTGALTPIQAEQLVHGVESLVTLLLENDYQLEPVFADRCDPGLPFKYEVVRFSLDLIDLYLVECATALNFNLRPVRLSTCNSHTNEYAKGLSAGIGQFALKMFINEASRLSPTPSNVINSLTSFGHHHHHHRRHELKKTSTIQHDLEPLAPDDEHAQHRLDSISNLSSSSSISSISLSSLNSSSSSSSGPSISSRSSFRSSPNMSDEQNTVILNSPLGKKHHRTFSKTSRSQASMQQNHHTRSPDSNEFNYWFECSSLSSGVITIDLALDEGQPEEQLKFLRLHDAKTKRLYFLWNDIIQPSSSSKRVCGCIGGCYYYSVFPDKATNRAAGFDFFDLEKSISRTSPNFGQSLFYPDKHILNSQPMMQNKYELSLFSYNSILAKCFSEPIPPPPQQYPVIATSSAPAVTSTTTLKATSLSPPSPHPQQKLAQSSQQLAPPSPPTPEPLQKQQGSNNSPTPRPINRAARSSVSTVSLRSSSATTGNEDDYYTADEDEEEGEEGNKEKSNQGDTTFEHQSVGDVEDELASTTLASNSQATKTAVGGVGGTTLLNDLSARHFTSEGAENKMDLNFDIKRPILDSSLPKYCYLKYLSRAQVRNWNRTYLYPCYHDSTQQNIFFGYRQHGINFFNLVSTSYSPKSNNYQTTTTSAENEFDDQNDNDDSKNSNDCKCRINLKFSVFECYITPLFLTGLGRFIEALNQYKVSPNSLITQLQTKAQAHSAANSFKEAISKTQVSLKIPQIRFFSLQCGLAEGDKISNAFTNTLANPDEFITLSLSTLCLYSIEIQLIDSQTRTAAIFMIDKIDTQFCRLFDPSVVKKMAAARLDLSLLNGGGTNSTSADDFIRLSCISNENSKTSIKYFNQQQQQQQQQEQNNPNSEQQQVVRQCDANRLKSLIMYECALDQISIKAIKQKSSDGRMSICEFDITKIWFSFPEPPISPKGKRKIPFTRFDWNLLSSVSPAVISWMCAYKNSIKPLQEYLKQNDERCIQILASLIAGSLRNKEQLEANMKYEYQKNAPTEFKSNFGARFRSKVMQQSKFAASGNTLTEMEKFLQVYLTGDSLAIYKDPNCRLVDLLRNYLFYFGDELKSDMESEFIPDAKRLKRGINELLNSWSTIIMASIENNTNTAPYHPYMTSSSSAAYYPPIGSPTTAANELENILSAAAAGGANQTNGAADQHLISPSPPPDYFKLDGNAAQAQQVAPHLEQQTHLTASTSVNLVAELDMKKNSVNSYVIGIEPNEEANTSSNNAADQTGKTINTEENLNISDDMTNKENKSRSGSTVAHQQQQQQQQQQQHMMAKNANKIFRPILSFIGIDAPSGTLIDNLFKEFGSLLFGNLKIKSVHINILGSALSMSRLLGGDSSSLSSSAPPPPPSSFNPNGSLNQQKGAPMTASQSHFRPNKSFYRLKSEKPGCEGSMDKIITTILSFDDLCWTASVRQVLPESSATTTTTPSGAMEAGSTGKTDAKGDKNQPMSMSNPLYTSNDSSNNKLSSTASAAALPLKYHTKIDAGIRINNLTQEVNMPLLRLVHQIYSIIADAIEYDKEQAIEASRALMAAAAANNIGLNNKTIGGGGDSFRLANPFAGGQLLQQQNLAQNSRDCWRYMAGLIELKDFLPEPKHVEKVEHGRKNSQRVPNKVIQVAKVDSFSREKTQVSFFGWINVKKINSRAGVGTLALAGEMNNIQLSVHMVGGRARYSSTNAQRHYYQQQQHKLEYEGSLNVCMDSTFGRLTENDTRQNVVQLKVQKSHLFVSLKSMAVNNLVASFAHIGHINFDVPLRPMIVHGVVYRESKVIEQKILPEIKNFGIFEEEKAAAAAAAAGSTGAGGGGGGGSSATGGPTSGSGATATAAGTGATQSGSAGATTSAAASGSANVAASNLSENLSRDKIDAAGRLKQTASLGTMKKPTTRIETIDENETVYSGKTRRGQKKHQLSLNNEAKKSLLHKFILHVKSKFDGIEVRAKLLETPCLKASYLIQDVEFNANLSNERSRLSCYLSSHCLSFQCDDEPTHHPQPSSVIFTTIDDRKTHFMRTMTRSLEDKFPPGSTSPTLNSSSSPFLTMKPLEERTNFFLPSISLTGTHFMKQIQLSETPTDTSGTGQKQQQHQQQQQATQNQALQASKAYTLAEMHMNLKIAQLSRELNAEVIAQLVFVTKVFIKEINHILQAVYGFENLDLGGGGVNDTFTPRNLKLGNDLGGGSTGSFPTSYHQQQQSAMIPTYFFYDAKVEIGKISLTGITPSNTTALSVFSGEQSVLTLTNRTGAMKSALTANDKVEVLAKLIRDSDYTLKPSIEAKCNLSVELKTSLKFEDKQQTNGGNNEVGETNERPTSMQSTGSTAPTTDDFDWYQLAYFNTRFELRNAIKKTSSTASSSAGLDRESIIITVDKPRFYLQPGSVDSAILFWLNYRSTYEFWLQQRQQFSQVLIVDSPTQPHEQPIFKPRTASGSAAQQENANSDSSQSTTNKSNFLTLKLRVTGLGLALPLSNKMTKDFFTTSTDCLVISLNETAIYACSSGCVVSKGQFSNFCLRFTENFNLASSEWAPSILFQQQPQQPPQPFYQMDPMMMAGGRPVRPVLINSWIVPYGNYEICSSTIEIPKLQRIDAHFPKRNPLWILSVKWKMEGIEVNLDTNIGKWLSKLADTVTRLAETQNITSESTNINDQDVEMKKLKRDLVYFMEKGDTSKANLIQSRLDLINLASYPERAKQIFVKTRNNLKGQLGFNSGAQQQSAQTPVKVNSMDFEKEKGKNLADAVTSAEKTVEETLAENNTTTSVGTPRVVSKQPNYKRHSHTRTHSADSAFSALLSFIKSVSNDELGGSTNEISSSATGQQQIKPVYQRPVILRPQLSDVREHDTLTTVNRQSQQQPPTQQQQQQQAAPTIDFKLNVKIEINSGKCVLHANKSGNGGGINNTNLNQPSTASYYGNYNSRLGPQGQASPLGSNYYTYMNEFNSMRAGANSPSNLPPQPIEQEMRNTNFIFPAIGVKAFYESTHKRVENPGGRLAKKANLYAMIKLESFAMPSHYSLSSYQMLNNRDMLNSRDMCISPALLDFLEQTLEPFDNLIKAAAAQAAATTSNLTTPPPVVGGGGQRKSDIDGSNTDADATDLDETIHFSQDGFESAEKGADSQSAAGGGLSGLLSGSGVDPSEEQQNDQQQQNNQQIIQQEPAYFPVDVVVFISMLPSNIRFTCQPQSTMECLLKLPSLEMVFSTNRIDSSTAQAKIESVLLANEGVDGLASAASSTTALSNSNEGGLNVTCSMTDFSLKFYNRLAIRAPFDARFFYNEQMMNYTEEKDSLSVRVAFVKVNISRTRRVFSRMSSMLGGEAASAANNGGTNVGPLVAVNGVTADDLNSSFRSGGTSYNDVKLSVIADIGTTSFVYDMRNIKEVFVFPKIWYRRSLARRVFLGEETTTVMNEADRRGSTSHHHVKSSDSKSLFNEHVAAANSQRREKRAKHVDSNPTFLNNDTEVLQQQQQQQLNPNLKTLVLVSVNLAGFEIKMNVGSVMGNVHLFTKNARVLSKLTMSRFGPKDVQFNFSIDSTRLIAEGGSNGCLLRIQDISAAIEVHEKHKLTDCPSHKLDFAVYAAECRIDSAYNQASPILAFRLSNLNLKLNDNWESNAAASMLHLVSIPSATAPAAAQSSGGGSLHTRLPEALMELNITWDQIHLMITRSTTPDLIILFYRLSEFLDKQFTESKDYIKECELDLFYEMKVKQQFIEKKETLLKRNFIVNGGNIQLKGNNLTVITFHGNSFSAIKWAVFSLNEPSLDFASQTYSKGVRACNQQNLSFYLGRSERKRDMASIYMVYRDSASIFTKYQTIAEWFEYAHSSIDAVGLRDFPRFTADEHPLMTSYFMSSQSVAAAVKKSKVNEQTRWEEIFHLPSLQIFYDTTQEESTVKFEFRTEFHDHIQLTFRTELFGFLHDLITNYIKETDLTKSKEPNIPNSKKDERIYECVKWELEPTLRLISKFGSSVEPIGVDALLKNLGFHHARSTIPKWLQRGLMDNLNEIMDGVIKLYVKLLADYDPTASSSSNSDPH